MGERMDDMSRPQQSRLVNTMPCERCEGTGFVLDPVATGAAMLALRIEAGLTLQSTAKHMGFSVSYLSRLENGQRCWSESLVLECHRAVLAAIRAGD